ncbi:MAG: hypothetical protein PHN84_05510 [Desulfuromonadaceae bacterium]|nr:hypothetical protein [Desulfuromonadaceae bacterium]MDD2855020.1 hypothetical protein [Desulfuromonadaceae bacterium]
MNKDGILVRVLGDYGPFSSMGKSIGYQVSIGGSTFLVDCGSPLFQQIGGHGLKAVKGLIITHCHDDHKRWFTDLSLFNLYTPDMQHKLPVFTSEIINDGLQISSGPSLNNSLSGDSSSVVDLSYNDYIDFHNLGPRPKFRIVSESGCVGDSRLFVVDEMGIKVGPERAKIVVSCKNGAARLLFKDPDCAEWIEPELFYPFSSATFYEDNRNIYSDPAGYTIEAINASVWHGIPSIGLRFKTENESLVFSGDTCNDLELWQKLHSEKRAQRMNFSKAEFDELSVIYGDINDYIERVWSRERYLDAISAFDNAVVIHDIAIGKSVVHTDYRRLRHTKLKKEQTILTHSPDKITSEWALSKAEKTFLIKGETFCEVVDDNLFAMNAAIYHKHEGRYYVGYRNPNGNTIVYDNDGTLNLGGEWDRNKGCELFRVDLYEDVSGRYLPIIAKGEGTRYAQRPDGRVERVTYSENGSSGVVVDDLRLLLAEH